MGIGLHCSIPIFLVESEIISMEKVLADDLIFEILAVVDEILAGKVATYGQIARLIDRPQNARLVGRVLSMAEFYGEYPYHRVVDHVDRLVPGWLTQNDFLAEEGIPLKDDKHIFISQC